MSRTHLEHVMRNTPHECTMGFSRHNSLIENLAAVFSSLARVFRFVYGYQNSLHFFVNPAQPLGEVDLLNASAAGNVAGGYRRLKVARDGYDILYGLSGLSEREVAERPIPRTLRADEVGEVLRVFELKASGANDGIVIPFDSLDLNLGVFVLWNTDRSSKSRIQPDEVASSGWLRSLYGFLHHLFVREFEIFAVDKTYLPSFRASKWKKTAVLFAEVKNFSFLEERRRCYTCTLGGDTQRVREVLDSCCKQMSGIVGSARGRIDRFFGTGMGAIFGEHDEQYDAAAASAVYAAIEMTKWFDDAKPGLMKRIGLEDYRIEYNDYKNVRIGAGVDFGTSLFEYLGDDYHRKYTAIGEHVNMAELLMNEATGYLRENERHSSILISPTVECLTRPWVEKPKEETIFDRSTGRTLTAYGISPERFSTDRYSWCREAERWGAAWEGFKRPY